MDKNLYVYINDKYEGVLNSEDDGKISFSYDEQAKMPLSMSFVFNFSKLMLSSEVLGCA